MVVFSGFLGSILGQWPVASLVEAGVSWRALSTVSCVVPGMLGVFYGAVWMRLASEQPHSPVVAADQHTQPSPLVCEHDEPRGATVGHETQRPDTERTPSAATASDEVCLDVQVGVDEQLQKDAMKSPGSTVEDGRKVQGVVECVFQHACPQAGQPSEPPSASEVPAAPSLGSDQTNACGRSSPMASQCAVVNDNLPRPLSSSPPSLPRLDSPRSSQCSTTHEHKTAVHGDADGGSVESASTGSAAGTTELTQSAGDSESQLVAPNATRSVSVSAKLWAVLRNPANCVLWLFGFFNMATLNTFASLWAPSFLSVVHGMDRELAALTASAVLLGWGFGSPIMGFVGGRVQPTKVLFASSLVGLVCMTLALYVPGTPVAILAVLFVGAGFATPIPVLFGAVRTCAVPVQDLCDCRLVTGWRVRTAWAGACLQPC